MMDEDSEDSVKSAEYQTLVRHTADLQLAVRENLTRLGGNLVSVMLLNSDQYAKIRSQHNAIEDRAADLVEFLKIKIQQNPDNFRTLTDVLNKDQNEYYYILEKLEHTYKVECERISSSTSRSKNAGQVTISIFSFPPTS